MNVQLVIGSSIETICILLVGYGLINLSTKNLFFSIVPISIISGVFLLPLKESFAAPIYLLICIGVLSLYTILILKVTFKYAVVGLLLGSLSLLISELLSLGILSLFTDVKVLIERNRLFTALPHFLIMFLVSIFIKRRKVYILDATRISSSNEFSNYINLSAFLLLLQFLTLYFFFYKNPNFSFNGFLSIFSVFIVLSILWLIKTLLSMISDKYENELDENLQQEIITHFQEVKSQRHDFIFHLNAINGLLYRNEYDECEKYVREVVDDVNAMNETLPVYHPAISALILSLKESAALKGITMNLNIRNDLSDLQMKVYEVNRVLGNLIRNAIEEVENSLSEKYITVAIYSDTTDIIFDVSNPLINNTEESILSMFDDGFTTKNKARNHGIGLTVVTQIVEKYGGFIFPELNDDVLSLKVNIPKVI